MKKINLKEALEIIGIIAANRQKVAETFKTAGLAASFLRRLDAVRDAIGKLDTDEPTYQQLGEAIAPGRAGESLRTEFSAFSADLSRAAKAVGQELALIKPRTRSAAPDLIKCHFEGELNLRLTLDDSRLNQFREATTTTGKARAIQVFVSFAFEDRKLVEDLITRIEERLPLRLAPEVREPVKLWAFHRDGGLIAGDPVKDAICSAIDNSRVHLLLVSPAYSRSNFINSVELPRILARAKGASFLPVALRDYKPAEDHYPPLAQYWTHTLRNQGKEFARLNAAGKTEAVIELCALIKKAILVPMPDARSSGVSEPVDPVPDPDQLDNVTSPVAAAITGSFEKHESILFTDMVDSSKLNQELGNRVFGDLRERHDKIVGDCVATSKGRIVKTTGDGVIALFDSPVAAVECALSIQHAVAIETWSPRRITVRLGIHCGTLTHGRDADGRPDVFGHAANLASRFMSLALPNQVLVSRAVYDDASSFLKEGSDPHPQLKWLGHGLYQFKGRNEPDEVFEVGNLGIAPFAPPPRGEKAVPIGPGEPESAPSAECLATAEFTHDARALKARERHFMDTRASSGNLTRIPEGGAQVAPDSSETAPTVAIHESLKQWRNSKSDVAYLALLGEAGAGKTMHCAAFDVANNEETPDSSLFIDLRHLNEAGLLRKNPNPTLSEIIGAVFARKGLKASADHVLRFVRERQGTIIWDGLDEVLVHLSQAQGLALFNQLVSALPPNMVDEPGAGRLMFACRTNYFKGFEDESSYFTGAGRAATDKGAGDTRAAFRVLRILPWKEDQIREYLSANAPQLPLDKAMEIIGSVHNLMDLAKRPFCLSLLRDVLPKLDADIRAGRIIRSVRLYDSLVELWLERDTGKHVIQPDDKPRIMAALAAWMWKDGTKQVVVAELGKWLRLFILGDLLLKASHEADFRSPEALDSLLKDLRNSTFVSRLSEESFRFAHTSLQEYFLAKHLIGALENGKIDDWTLPEVNRETLDFAAELLAQLRETSPASAKRADASLCALLENSKPERSQNGLRFWLRLHTRGEAKPMPKKLDASGLDLTGWEFNNRNLPDGSNHSGPLLLPSANFSEAKLNRIRFNNVDFGEPLTINEADLRGSEWLSCDIPHINFDNVLTRWSHPLFRKCRVSEGRVPAKEFRNWLPIAEGTPSGAPRLETRVGKFAQWNLGHTSLVRAVAFSPNGKWLLSGGSDGTLRQWNAATGQCTRLFDVYGNMISSVAYSPDGTWLACGSWGNSVQLWNTATGQCLWKAKNQTSWIDSVVFSPKGSILASGDHGGVVRLFDATTGQCIQEMKGHKEGVSSVAFSNDGAKLASAGFDRTVRLWEPDTGRCLHVLEGHKALVRGVAFGPDSTRLASGSLDRTVRLWTTSTGHCIRVLEGHKEGICSIAYSPDGARLASGSLDGTVRLWDATTGISELVLEGHSEGEISLAFSPEGARLSVGTSDGSVWLWDAISGKCIRAIQRHHSATYALALWPDQTCFASGEWNGAIRVWDSVTGKSIRVFDGQGQLTSLAVSPNGKLLASGSFDGTVWLWDLADGTCMQVLRGQEEGVIELAFSPLSTQLVSLGREGDLLYWDIGERKRVRVSKTVSRAGKEWLAFSRASTINRGLSVRTFGSNLIQVLNGDTVVMEIASLPPGNELVLIPVNESESVKPIGERQGMKVARIKGPEAWRYANTVNHETGEIGPIEWSFDENTVVEDLG